MTDNELRDVLNAIAKKYPKFIEGKNRADIKSEWQKAIGNADFDSVMQELKKHMETKRYAPNPNELRTFSAGNNEMFSDDYTFRKIAIAYADSCHIKAPNFANDMDAYAWIGEQETMRA